MVSTESSVAFIHGSRGNHPPALPELLSEPAILAGIAKATLDANPKLDWDAWATDYRLIRAAIAQSYREDFRDFEARLTTPGGFARPVSARQRVWKTKTSKANFIGPPSLSEDADMQQAAPDVLRMMTLRSNDQFNTTLYGCYDRFGGIKGTRMVVLMNRDDIARLGLAEGQSIGLETVAEDGVRRVMVGFRCTADDITVGCIGTYCSETNALIPLWHYAKGTEVPAAKSVPVRVVA